MLPETLTVYRGVTSHNSRNIKALSWTLDRDKAEWFAHRFDENGTVYEAEIDKKYVLAFFASRNEAEVWKIPPICKISPNQKIWRMDSPFRCKTEITGG